MPVFVNAPAVPGMADFQTEWTGGAEAPLSFLQKGLAFPAAVVYNTGMRPAPDGGRGRTEQECGGC